MSQAFIDNGGLRAHEGIRDAHTMRRHYDGVNGLKTDAEIAGREDLSSAGNSAFRLAEDDLNRLIGRTLDSRADAISNWLHMEPKPKPRTFTITATFDQAIGRRFSDGIFTDEKQLWMQLLWDKNSPGGFVIRTAYPTRLGG